MNSIKSVAAGLFLGIAAVAMTATSAISVPITLPSGLNPGDQYRLAFVTSSTRDALSTNIADYNNFVDALGDTAIASDWKVAWMNLAWRRSKQSRDNVSNGGLARTLLATDDHAMIQTFSATATCMNRLRMVTGVRPSPNWWMASFDGTQSSRSGGAISSNDRFIRAMPSWSRMKRSISSEIGISCLCVAITSSL
jgi:hypothetical protein